MDSIIRTGQKDTEASITLKEERNDIYPVFEDKNDVRPLKLE